MSALLEAPSSSGHAPNTTMEMPSGLDTSRTSSTYVTSVKPAVDRVVGTALLVAASPLLAIASAMVAKEMGRPIFFTQDRIGKDGVPFTMYKFRSMLPDRRRGTRTGTAADRGKPQPETIPEQPLAYVGTDRRLTHKSDHDPRHTRLGRFLRKTSIDELPQLWNVMKGEMSLVGPRPELKSVVDSQYTPWQNQRHIVKPGLTGMWQVTKRAEGRLMLEDTQCDLDYIEQVSPALDFKILAATPMVLLGRGDKSS